MPRHPYKEHRRYNIQHLWDRHHEIKRMVFMGMTNEDIAQALGCHKQTVSITRNSPIVRAELDKMQAVADGQTIDIAIEIKNLAPKALRFIESEVLDNPDASRGLRYKAAVDLLDRAGHVKPTKVMGEILHGHLTREDIEQAKQRAIEEGLKQGTVIIQRADGSQVIGTNGCKVLDTKTERRVENENEYDKQASSGA